jgi:hypothetical protein
VNTLTRILARFFPAHQAPPAPPAQLIQAHRDRLAYQRRVDAIASASVPKLTAGPFKYEPRHRANA